MIFTRPGLGLGIGNGPVVTSGLGLIVIIVVVEPTTEHLPSSKKLDRRRSKTLTKVLKENPTKVGTPTPKRANVVAASVLRSPVPDGVSAKLPEKKTRRAIGQDSSPNLDRRNRMNPDRKPRY